MSVVREILTYKVFFSLTSRTGTAYVQCPTVSGLLYPYTYMYVSGNPMSTVDYIIASLDATSITSSCKTLAIIDLNTSDLLPLVAELAIECPVQIQLRTCNNTHPRLDWEQAIKSGEINEYRKLVKHQLSWLISHACSDGVDTLKDAAAKLIPEMSYKKPHKT